ncbi:MAG: hypothetical protein HRT61_11265 [Ekhidna sp.]|nr:hypothetical protein [Ekhidna sp.]
MRIHYEVGQEVVLRVNAEIGYIHRWYQTIYDGDIYEVIVKRDDKVFMRNVMLSDIVVKTGTIVDDLPSWLF